MLASIVFIYLAVCAGMYFLQDRLVFPGTSIAGELPHAPNLEPVSIDRGDGVVLRGVLRKPTVVSAARAPVILYFGGNAEEVTWWATYAGWPPEWAVLLVNYRGFGQSSGTASEQSMYVDALALHDWAAARVDIDAARMVAFGRSLGSGVATYLAAERPIVGTILATPFDSAVAVARAVYPWLPVSLLLRHRFESIARAPQLRAPLLMLVATDDRVIPNPHSERLYSAWAGAKRVTRIDGADHTDVASDPRYWSAISAFLTAFQ